MPNKNSKLQVKTKKLIKKTSKASGLVVDVYDIKGKVISKVSLPKDIFGAKVNPVLMAQAVRVYLANQRIGTASTKTRGEVQGSTRKIRRQKHTGRARHGGIRAPIFVGGGIVFGPKPRDFSLKLPKKMKRKALLSALTSKLKEKCIKVIDNLEKITPKTAVLYQGISKVLQEDQNKKKWKVLLVTPGKVENVYRAARNIENVTIARADLLTTYEILNSKQVLLMKSAIDILQETYGPK